MTKFKRTKLKNLKLFIKKLPKLIAEKAFFSFLAFFMLSLIISAAVFYQYSIMPQKYVSEISQTSLRFKTNTYEEILNIWENKKEQLEQTDIKVYPNLFIR